MRSEAVTVSPRVSIGELVHDHIMDSDDHSFPVLDSGRLVGMVTLQDVRSVPRENWHALTVSKVLAQREPDRLTAEVRKAKRDDRVFLDYLRNSYAQTGVRPYAVRVKPGAPVATPLDRDELSDRSLHSQSYTLVNVFRRLGQKDDPWRTMMHHAYSLEKPRLALRKLQEGS
jgi:DNA primase